MGEKLTLTRLVLKTCDFDLFIFVNRLTVHGIREHVLEVRILGFGQGRKRRKRFVGGDSTLMLVAGGQLLFVCED